MPTFLLDLGAKLGDLANRLGWMPPMRISSDIEYLPLGRRSALRQFASAACSWHASGICQR